MTFPTSLQSLTFGTLAAQRDWWQVGQLRWPYFLFNDLDLAGVFFFVSRGGQSSDPDRFVEFANSGGIYVVHNR